jgi:MutS domain V
VKAFLMHADHDFTLDAEPPAQAQALTRDLELETLLRAMAAGDDLIFHVARQALLLSLRDPQAIVYRQQVLTDCLAQPGVVRELYRLAGDALKAEKSVWGSFRYSPRTSLGSSIQKLQLFVDFLRQLRELTDAHAHAFSSPGFTRFFATLRDELDEDYFELIAGHLGALQFKNGILMSARLAAGNKGRDYTLRRPRDQGLLERVFDRSGYSFTIPERDESGFRALSDLEDNGLNLVANALAQAVDHVHSFFVMLRVEIGFYVGCLNLSEQLVELGVTTALPVASGPGTPVLSARGLYDVCLRLTTAEPVVANDIEADGKSLVMITGANQGGKSTFLRSIGLAQLMAQCGMFVAAESLRANVCDGVFTHYKREEDPTMESGKLDEELARMSDIADHITSGGLRCATSRSRAQTSERARRSPDRW